MASVEAGCAFLAGGDHDCVIGLGGGSPMDSAKMIDDWQRQQWRSLQTAYGSAPFWDFYAPVFEPFFTERFDFLLDFNVEILKTIFKLLKIDKTVNICLSTRYEAIFTEGVDFRQTISPKIQSDFKATPYSQLFNDRYDFIPNLSILDVLFCCGNQSLSVLKSLSTDYTNFH